MYRAAMVVAHPHNILFIHIEQEQLCCCNVFMLYLHTFEFEGAVVNAMINSASCTTHSTTVK